MCVCVCVRACMSACEKDFDFLSEAVDFSCEREGENCVGVCVCVCVCEHPCVSWELD